MKLMTDEEFFKACEVFEDKPKNLLITENTIEFLLNKECNFFPENKNPYDADNFAIVSALILVRNYLANKICTMPDS